MTITYLGWCHAVLQHPPDRRAGIVYRVSNVKTVTRRYLEMTSFYFIFVSVIVVPSPTWGGPLYKSQKLFVPRILSHTIIIISSTMVYMVATKSREKKTRVRTHAARALARARPLNLDFFPCPLPRPPCTRAHPPHCYPTPRLHRLLHLG